jgi:tyrosinase
MTVASPSASRAPVQLRHRRSVRRLSKSQLGDLRQAVTLAQKIGDDRGYQYWAGIHGLPLPKYCRHSSELFLPWHRAYLYFFEKALQDQVPGVTLPWWDWRDHSEAIPAAYARARTPEGTKNPLASSPIQPSGRRQANEKRTWRQPGDPNWLPSGAEVDQVRANRDYFTFQN